MNTDLQKFRDFFDKIGIKYRMEKDQKYIVRKHSEEDYWKLHKCEEDVLIMFIDCKHFIFNYNPEIRVLFNSHDESFIAFESWGE